MKYKEMGVVISLIIATGIIVFIMFFPIGNKDKEYPKADKEYSLSLISRTGKEVSVKTSDPGIYSAICVDPSFSVVNNNGEKFLEPKAFCKTDAGVWLQWAARD